MLKCFLIFSIIISTLAAQAVEPSSDEIKNLMLAANIPEVIVKLEAEAPELGEKNSEYYAISLISDGQIEKLEAFLKTAKKKYKKNTVLKEIQEQIKDFNKSKALIKLKPIKTEAEALKIISQKRKILFPKTHDFYELAMAYKTLAILSVEAKDIKNATKFIKLGKDYIYKMRSVWLEEDIIIEKPIMKTTERHTRFGFLIPQWIMLLRSEFDNFLI